MLHATDIPKTHNRTSWVAFDLIGLQAKEVFIVGSFNEWRPGVTPMTALGEGMWGTRLSLAPGRYEYQFLVDGRSVADPSAEEFVQTPEGSVKSVLVVTTEGAA